MDEKEALTRIVELAGNTCLPTKEAMEEYDPSRHKVFNEVERPKKEVSKPTGLKDENGEDIMRTTYEEVNRIAIPFQKLIVSRRVAFMNVGKTEIMAKPEDDIQQRMTDIIKKIRDDNKMQFREKEVARRMCSELQVAKLWYSEEIEDGKSYWGDLVKQGGRARMRVKILSPELGDKLFPVLDRMGNMVYFGRGYKARPDITDISQVTEEALKSYDKEIEHFDIYSKEYIYKFEREEGSSWQAVSSIPNPYGKIPVIYYSQKQPIWHDVQPIIERLEEVISNFGDTNDYNGSPILVAKGEIKGFSSKGERGKVMEITEDGDIKYVTWDQAPESIKLEIETLMDLVYTCTQTPNISFKEMAGLGAKSGVAFDRVFMDAQLAAQDMIDDVYGECTQREINFLKSAATVIDTSLKPAEKMDIWAEIPVFRINDTAETVNMLTSATGGKPVLSQKTAVGMSGLVDDPEEEWDQIQEEEDSLGKDIDNVPGGPDPDED